MERISSKGFLQERGLFAMTPPLLPGGVLCANMSPGRSLLLRCLAWTLPILVAGCASLHRPCENPTLPSDVSEVRSEAPLMVHNGAIERVDWQQDPAEHELAAEFEPAPWLDPQEASRTVLGDVLADHRGYYSPANLGRLAAGVGLAAAMANTKLDKRLKDHYQQNLRDMPTDEFSEAVHTPEVLGNGYVTIPVFAATAVVGSWFDEVPLGKGLGEWGERSLRTILVGAPPMLAMQLLTGASRPGETYECSQWAPFRDDNGARGH